MIVSQTAIWWWERRKPALEREATLLLEKETLTVEKFAPFRKFGKAA